MRFPVIIFLLFSIYSEAYSTPQIPDYIVYDGDTLELLQRDLMNGRRYTREELDQMTIDNKRNATNCWDGQYSIWQLRNDSLILIENRKCNSNEILQKENLLAKWYTGKLFIPKGRIIYNDPYSGLPPTYEEEIELQIKNGVVENRKILDNKRTSTVYLNSNRLTELLLESLDDNQITLLKKKKSFTSISFIVKLNDEWRVDSVTFYEFETDPEIDFITEKSIIEMLKNIRNWDRIYLHGTPYEAPFTHDIFFDRKTLKKIR